MSANQAYFPIATMARVLGVSEYSDQGSQYTSLAFGDRAIG